MTTQIKNHPPGCRNLQDFVYTCVLYTTCFCRIPSKMPPTDPPIQSHLTGRNGIPPSFSGQVASLILGEFLHALQQKTLHLKLHISVLQKRFFFHNKKSKLMAWRRWKNQGILRNLRLTSLLFMETTVDGCMIR